jgi:hypothetical protein
MKNHNGYKKRRKNIEKMHQKKLLAKMWRKYALFFTFTRIRQTCFACNFFWCIFYKFFNGFEISVKFCVFDIFFDFFQQNFFGGHISTFCKLWSEMRKKRLKKSKNVFCKCVLEFNFAPIKESVFFIFEKKVKCVVPPSTYYSINKIGFLCSFCSPDQLM